MDISESQTWPDRRRRRRFIVALSLAGTAALLFLWLVWPTPYRYARNSEYRRISRFTGEAQVYDKRKDEWRPAKGGRRNGSATRGGGSPIGGGRGDDWEAEGRDEGSVRTGKKKPKGEQWWYSEGERSGGASGSGSPIGGSRRDEEDSRKSPIGGD